jgi:hypothetical protein
MFSTGEKEDPLHSPLRTYILHAVTGANSRDLSIVREGASSVLYTTSVAPTIDMHHPNSITLTSPSSTVVGAARMYHGCDTINLALGDPEAFSQRENCVWEDLHITKQALKGSPATHHFGLGLGDDARRFFHWVLDKTRPQPTPVQLSSEVPQAGRTHSWSITEHVPGLARAHTFSFSGKSMPKKDETVTTVHEVRIENSSRRCFKLIDRDDGEIVAMLLRHEDVRDGALVRDEDPSVRGKFVIFRDFWEPGQYQEEWDRVVLLSGLAVLERGDRE